MAQIQGGVVYTSSHRAFPQRGEQQQRLKRDEYKMWQDMMEEFFFLALLFLLSRKFGISWLDLGDLNQASWLVS